MSIEPGDLQALPKVVLHDHLDGGLRPETVVELAADIGHELPAEDPTALAEWFATAADSGSLETYLQTFDQTLAVMQSVEGLIRVAREAAIDLASDGVIYAEQRYAPEQHLRGGLSLDEVVEAVQEGFAQGCAVAGLEGNPIRIGTLITAMRQADRAEEIAELAIAHRDDGVVGFDIAGPEAGFPPSRHIGAFEALREACMPYTIHAGEGAGPESIWEAVGRCGTLRLGHGVRIAEDLDGLPADPSQLYSPDVTFGPLAHWVRDNHIPLEVCPCSNLQTGIAPSIAAHPITALTRLGFTVTLNTDNRLMSRTSMSHEMTLLMAEAGWTLADLREVTVNAARAAFVHEDERAALIDVILPAWNRIVEENA